MIGFIKEITADLTVKVITNYMYFMCGKRSIDNIFVSSIQNSETPIFQTAPLFIIMAFMNMIPRRSRQQ